MKTLPASPLVCLVAFVFCGVLSAGSLDDNGNQMSDVWEAAYGRGLVASEDPDGDSKTNLQESIAGTDPKNAASALRVSDLEMEVGSVARLRWGSVAGKSYQVGVSFDMVNWQDVGVPLAGTGGTMESSLPLATTFLTGRAAFSRWTNQATNANLETVRANAAGNITAPEAGFLTTLETPATSPNQDNYGQWVRGWIVPATSGNYTFWIASDDQSEFWLSPDANPVSKVKIAAVPNWTNFRQWTKSAGQQSAPIALVAGQSYYFEALQKEWSGGDHLSVAWTGPGFATQTVIDGRYLATSGNSLAQSMSGSIFFRVSVSDQDRDADGVSDADEALVGFDPLTATTTPRVNDAGSIRSALAARNSITVGAPESRAYEADLQKGRFTFFRAGNLDPVTIHYTVGGTASAGSDYEALSGTVQMGVGKNRVDVEVVPVADGLVEAAESVTVSVVPSTSYDSGNPAQATVMVDDAPDILFVANLRADAATQSRGYGTAAINVAGNGVFGNVSVSFGNLLGNQTSTQLYVSTTGASGATVLQLPAGQIPETRWDFLPAAGLTGSELRTALSDGRLYARVTSSALPGGEIFGRFVSHLAWQTMPLPPDPPALVGGPVTAADAARFLVQTTYGPTLTDIAHVQAIGYDAWLEEQFAATPTWHLPSVQTRRAELLAASAGVDDGWQRPRQEAWWQVAVTAPDQLRQRMALALSEIFVVSDVGVLDGSHEGITNYYDMLVAEAFGNYRSLLGKVTLSPIMGQYLSMVRNQKPNPVTGSEPDENYAREVMQLFSIGLSQLNLDGSLKLGATGMPVPTYSEADIVGLARVFTGWSYQPAAGETPNFFWGTRDEFNPMVEFAAYHDTNQKIIVNNTVIPGNQTMSQDLQQALDTLGNHPNVAPFIARQLIQRFVTSNPSPGYIYRVASVFNNNGSGVRGDLKAVLKAILLDYEARSPDFLTDRAHGKLKEPILRKSHLLRALKVTPPKPGDPRFFVDYENTAGSQAALKSPSVFNFFQPGYIPPGVLALNGLYGPEFQITSETTIINQNNAQHNAIFWGLWIPDKDPAGTNYSVALNPADEVAILERPGFTPAENQAALLDHLNLVFLNGRMSPGLRQSIMDAYTALPSWFTGTARQKDRVNMAVWIIMASPEYAIQK